MTTEQIEAQIKMLQEQKDRIKSMNIKQIADQKFKETRKKKLHRSVSDYKQELNRLRFCAHVDAVFETILSEHIEQKYVDIIMKYLRKSAKCSDFSRMMSAYSQFKDLLEYRQLIKFCSATYRLKMTEFNKHTFTNSSTYKSEMKYASSCEECGKLAYNVALQMRKINFI